MANKNLYQHFRSDEKDFIEKIDDLANRVEDTYTYKLTEFLNPRQIEIARSVLATRGFKYFVSNDIYSTEYARLLITPDYYELEIQDFELALLEINYNRKFNQLKHSQIMGTLLHKLGLKRSVIGDILITDGYAQLLVDRAMLNYFQDNITKIGKASVSLKELPLDKLIQSKSDSLKFDIMVSSMRLDKVIAVVLKLSRSQSVQLIESDRIKINYQIHDKVSEILQVGDLISVRGFGRFSILKDNGLSKNGKHKLSIEKMIHK